RRRSQRVRQEPHLARPEQLRLPSQRRDRPITRFQERLLPPLDPFELLPRPVVAGLCPLAQPPARGRQLGVLVRAPAPDELLTLPKGRHQRPTPLLGYVAGHALSRIRPGQLAG